MKTAAEKRLFWFLKEGTELDLTNKVHLDMYVQQILSRGTTPDIKRLFEVLAFSDFIESLNRIKSFLPSEVRKFWEECVADTYEPSNKPA